MLAMAATALWAAAAAAWVDDADLTARDVVFLGEVHDNPIHHAHQAEALRALRPAAVVFEMLTPEQAARVNGYESLPEADALARALDWGDSGWPDFAMYHPVFEAAGAAGARVYGTTLPRERLTRAMAGALAEAFGGEAARFGLGTPLDAGEQATREALQRAAHCDALPEAMLPGMVAVQRLRDAHIARTALAALEETGGPVAVITGSGHARTDWGAPALLRLAAPEARVFAVGQLEEDAAADPPPFDLLVTTAPALREDDPCARLR
jgi:uncharacterized iron-regulated protein